jgi:CheY-like chemotaxis protein
MATVLIVDDVEMFRTVVAHALRGAGHRAVSAPDGAAALRALETADADLVLLDLAMPNMNGMEFLQRLRADARFETLPVIVVSALSSAAQLGSVTELGVQAQLLKSRFSLRDLVECVNDVVAKTAGDRAGPSGAEAAA